MKVKAYTSNWKYKPSFKGEIPRPRKKTILRTRLGISRFHIPFGVLDRFVLLNQLGLKKNRHYFLSNLQTTIEKHGDYFEDQIWNSENLVLLLACFFFFTFLLWNPVFNGHYSLTDPITSIEQSNYFEDQIWNPKTCVLFGMLCMLLLFSLLQLKNNKHCFLSEQHDWESRRRLRLDLKSGDFCAPLVCFLCYYYPICCNLRTTSITFWLSSKLRLKKEST